MLSFIDAFNLDDDDFTTVALSPPLPSLPPPRLSLRSMLFFDFCFLFEICARHFLIRFACVLSPCGFINGSYLPTMKMNAESHFAFKPISFTCHTSFSLGACLVLLLLMMVALVAGSSGVGWRG